MRKVVSVLGRRQKAHLEEREQTASKRMKCAAECGEPIRPGERYVRCMWPGEHADEFILRKFHRACREAS